MNNNNIPFQNYRLDSEQEDLDHMSNNTDKIDNNGNFTSDDEGIALSDFFNEKNIYLMDLSIDDDKAGSSKYGDHTGSEGEPCRSKASQDNMDRRR
jgi:hypothetical protein